MGIFESLYGPPPSPGSLLDPMAYNPRGDMILALAGQLLANGAPSTTPRGMLTGVPQAVMGAGQASRQNAMAAMQYQAAKTQQDQIARQTQARQHIAGLLGGGEDQQGLLGDFADAYPEQFGSKVSAALFPSDKGGPFQGTALDAQEMNLLLKGDPASAEYRAAYNHFGQPKMVFDPATGTMQVNRPDMSAFRQPGGEDSAAMGDRGGVTTQQVQPPAMTGEQRNEAGQIRQQRAGIQGAIAATYAFKDAFGAIPGAEGKLGFGLAGKALGPNAVWARSQVFNVASSIIKERAGSAQTPAELQRINSFLPSEFDNAATIVAKLNAFDEYLKNRESAITNTDPNAGWTATPRN